MQFQSTKNEYKFIPNFWGIMRVLITLLICGGVGMFLANAGIGDDFIYLFIFFCGFVLLWLPKIGRSYLTFAELTLSNRIEKYIDTTHFIICLILLIIIFAIVLQTWGALLVIFVNGSY